jgi:Domain of unknown function (DUF4276)
MEEKLVGRETCTMSRMYLLVEGQTEEAFVNELLVAHYARLGLFLIPIIVSTSPGYKEGVVSYAKIKPQIVRLCKQETNVHVTTMFDLYALPADFPGKNAPHFPNNGSGHQKATFLEQALALDVSLKNFIPNLIVHEFESLLFVQAEQFALWFDPNSVKRLFEVRRSTLPEDINDSPHTAPSKRILSYFPSYQKTVHGPLIASDLGLDTIRLSCPHFDVGLKTLERFIPKN